MPSINADSLVRPATWPALSAQGVQGLAAERAVLEHCALNASWEQADGCWKCVFAPPGTMLYFPDTEKFVLSLGHVGYTALLLWDLTKVDTAEGEYFYLATETSSTSDDVLPVLSWDAVQAVPSAPLSPAGFFLANGCKLAPVSGLLLQKRGEPEGLLQFAAKQAFGRSNSSSSTRWRKTWGSQAFRQASTTLWPFW